MNATIIDDIRNNRIKSPESAASPAVRGLLAHNKHFANNSAASA